MKITRIAATRLNKSIESLQQNENFSLATKYKILKLKEIVSKEQELNSFLMIDFASKYGGIDENGNVYIEKKHADQVNKELREFNNELIEVPDLTIKLEELSSEVKWSELESFMPFIVE